jgi:hypothetical protein
MQRVVQHARTPAAAHQLFQLLQGHLRELPQAAAAVDDGAPVGVCDTWQPPQQVYGGLVHDRLLALCNLQQQQQMLM